MFEIDDKNEIEDNLYTNSYFTEQLVDAFEKSLRESDLNYKTSSFLIRQLKNYTGFPLQ
jgi:hypothetical protein